jgi:hypothetical protein
MAAPPPPPVKPAPQEPQQLPKSVASGNKRECQIVSSPISLFIV